MCNLLLFYFVGCFVAALVLTLDINNINKLDNPKKLVIFGMFSSWVTVGIYLYNRFNERNN